MARVSDADLAGLVGPGVVVLFGELHGTHEFGETVARLARLAVGQGLPTAVALELPRDEQPALDAFLSGPDDADARAALTRSPYWHPDQSFDDGRAGRGTLRLLRALHAVAGQAPTTGGRLVVRLVDTPCLGLEVGTPVPADLVAVLTMPRDEAMAAAAAQAFDAVDADRTGFGVLLAGNAHTRVRRRVPFEPAPAGVFLARRFPGAVAVHGHHSGGCCRAATSDRGAEPVRFAPAGSPAGATGRYDRRDARRTGHDRWLNVGHLTPSSPLPPAAG